MSEAKIGWFRNRAYWVPPARRVEAVAGDGLPDERWADVASRLARAIGAGLSCGWFELWSLEEDGAADALACPFAVGDAHEGVLVSLESLGSDEAVCAALSLLEPVANALRMDSDAPLVVGFWRDPEEGELAYFDLASLVHGRSLAEALALRRGQDTVCDLRAGEEICVGPHEGGAQVVPRNNIAGDGYSRWMRVRHGLSVYAPGTPEANGRKEDGR